MPMYEYQCVSCGEQFEELVSIRETVNPPCPKCASAKTEKKVSRVGGFGGMSGGGSSCGGGGKFT